MDEGLLRQRRNLMVMCCLLLLLSASGVNVEKLGFGGVEMKFDRPSALFGALWVAWAYYLYRYYVYFMTKGRAEIATIFRGASFQAFQKRVHEEAATKHGVTVSLDAGFSWQSLWANPLRLPISFLDGTGNPKQHKIDYELSMSKFQRLVVLLRVWARLALNNTATTDYVFPFALAVGTFIYGGWADWQGSFANFSTINGSASCNFKP